MSENLSRIAKFGKTNLQKSRSNPKLFFFTDRKRFDNIFQIIENLPKNTAIIIREYDLKYKDRLLFAKEIVLIARKKGLITLSGKSLKLHLEAKTDGIHFSDNEKSWGKYLSYQKRNFKLFLSCACHSEKSIRKAQKFGVNFIFFSPIFETASHPQTKIIGHLRLAKFTREFGNKSNIYGLGGVNERSIKLLKNINISGIGFISLAKQLS